MADYQTITLANEGPVAVLTLNRPERLNAINQRMLSEIQTACDEVEADDGTRALVVTSAGKAFSAGFDLQDQAASTPQGHDEWRPVLRRDFEGVIRFWRLSKPTVLTFFPRSLRSVPRSGAWASASHAS